MSVRVRRPTRAERLAQAMWWVDHPVAPVRMLLDAGILTEHPGKDKLCLSEVLEAVWARAHHGTGRRRALSIRTLLVGLHLARSWEGTSFLHDGYCELERLEPEERHALGIGSRTSLTKRRFDYLWGEVVATFDPEPVPSRRLGEAFPTYEDKVGAAARPADDADRLASWRRIVTTTACLAGVPDELLTGTVHVAVDWTDHDTWSRPVAKDSVVFAADPQAKWGSRRNKAVGERRDPFFGYDRTTVTLLPKVGGEPVPEVVLFSDLLPASPTESANVWLAVDAIELLVAFGLSIGDVVVDMAYPLVPGFAERLVLLGVKPVFHPHTADRGPHGTHKGAVMINGHPYCPMTPEPLRSIGKGVRFTKDHAEDAKGMEPQVKQLEAYRLEDRGKGRSPGSVRVACPARAGNVACPLYPPSMARAAQVPVVEPDEETVAAHHQACTQRDVTVPLSARDKYAQDGVPFTKSHNKRYFRRSGVERGYAKDKDRAQGSIVRGDIRTMGRTKIGFLLAVHHGAQNVADLWTRATYAAGEVMATFKRAATKLRGRSMAGELATLAARLVPWVPAGTDLAVLFGGQQLADTGPPT
ncbi:MAG: hypothetical protein ACRDWN_08140 [Acidimicrobiales bacterium]